MKLSIITVNLNNASGLRQTMDSVMSQTSHDFEHIIIDGGSTDGSVEVIKSFTNIPPGIYSEANKKYSMPYDPAQTTKGVQPDKPCAMPITYWISEPDHGIYHAMNKGIMIARGEYCQFLNSGDWLAASEVIEKMLDSKPGSSIYYGNMLKIMQNRKIHRDKGGEGDISLLTFYKGTLNHSTAFIKRSLFDKYGLYDETLKIVSDWKWYLIAIGLNNESVQYTNLDVTRFDMNGISNTNPQLEKQERRMVLEELLPANILNDYDSHLHNIEQAVRIKRYKLSKFILWFVERILFKLEKWKII